MFRRFVTLIFTASLALTASADNKTQNVLDLRESITDSNIIFPESFETNTTRMLEGWYMQNYTATDDRYKTDRDVPVSDELLQDRLAKLPTVIEMPYNQIVRSYIERYTQRGRSQVAAILGLSLYYMPIFEQALEEAGLPLELKYLPVIESGLDPNAVSRHGAAGLWQFMLSTARGLGMEVNSLVDERRDPYVSSKKAARYLKDLYATYNDWSLAIAAYNCGPGSVNKAIRRAGGEPSQHDFWSIYNYLSPETRGYVPMFIAANYVMNYYPQHNISPVLPTKPLIIDTVMVDSRIHFDQISKVLAIPVDELRVLNPQFRSDVIPGSTERAYMLALPSQQIHAYLMSENDIREFEKEKYQRRLTAQPGDTPSEAVAAQIESEPSVDESESVIGASGDADRMATNNGKSRTITHKVEPGESLAEVAKKYDVTPEQIKNWNNLRRNALRTGQLLRITTAVTGDESVENTSPRSSQWQESTVEDNEGSTSSSKSPAKTGIKQQTAKTKNAAPATSSHKVKSGESLSSISKKYGVSIEELKRANGMKSDNLRAGQTLTIPTKGGSVAKTSRSGAKKTSSKTGTTKKRSKRRR